MAQITKEIVVDVAKKNLFQAIVAKQNDNNSRFLKVTLCNEGVKIEIPSSATAIINAERADSSSKAFAGTVNADGTVTVPLTNWMLGLDDVVRCSISVIGSDEQKLTSTSFSIDVEAAEYEGSDITEDENYDILITLISDVSDAKLACETATEEARTLMSKIEQKLENGEFVGAKGDKGDPGEKGDKGDPGTDAEVTLAGLAELYDGAVAQRALQITDAVPLRQRSGSVMAKVTLQVLRSFVLDAVKKIYNDEGYSAALPDEMSADGVLALVSDIPDVSGKQDKSTLAADVAAAGFTKNSGTYSKPSGGIPKSDLAQAVQSSLGKADSALQSVPNTYALKADIPSIPTNVSSFTNDSGYLTLETLPKYDGGVE